MCLRNYLFLSFHDYVFILNKILFSQMILHTIKHTDDSQIFIFSSSISFEFQTQIYNSLINISVF